jgi:outer membrane protein TolC
LAAGRRGTYSLGPSISVPIFEGGRLAGTLDLTKTEQPEAAIAFQKTVLNAWQEVDNALVAYAEEQRRNGALNTQVDQARPAVALARDQDQKGTTDFPHVLDAERQALSAERQEADRAALATNLVALYKALGGGRDEGAIKI